MENTIIKLDNVVKRYSKKEALKGINLVNK